MTSSTIYNDILPICHIRIEIIHGSHMYILFLPRVGLYGARGKPSWHKGLPVVKTIYSQVQFAEKVKSSGILLVFGQHSFSS
jgi:hypothetical protein